MKDSWSFGIFLKNWDPELKDLANPTELPFNLEQTCTELDAELHRLQREIWRYEAIVGSPLVKTDWDNK